MNGKIDSNVVSHFSFVLFLSFTSRKHKRYYYTNDDTQQSQWDFPVEDLKEKEQDSNQTTASVVSMTTTMATTIMPTTMTQATLNVATPVVQTWNTAAGLMAVPMMPMGMTSVSHAATMPMIGKDRKFHHVNIFSCLLMLASMKKAFQSQ